MGNFKESEFGSHRSPRTIGVILVSYGLGSVFVSFGILIALHSISPRVAAVGSFLVVLMALTTLSFAVITPEARVSGAGSTSTNSPISHFPDCW